MSAINDFLSTVDNLVWGVPLMVLILAGGLLLTVRLGLLQVRKLPLALKWMIKNEEEAEGARGEITSFAALCTALSATIGTGNIVGVATAVGAGGPGALFWMIVAAFLWYGNQVFRRSACCEVSCGSRGRTQSWWSFLLY